jgi:hypothetical protein
MQCYQMLAVASVPAVYATAQLDEGILCVFFELGKLGYSEVFSSFVEKRLAQFFKSSKVPSTGDSLMSCCSNFFDDWH